MALYLSQSKIFHVLSSSNIRKTSNGNFVITTNLLLVRSAPASASCPTTPTAAPSSCRETGRYSARVRTVNIRRNSFNVHGRYTGKV